MPEELPYIFDSDICKLVVAYFCMHCKQKQ